MEGSGCDLAGGLGGGYEVEFLHGMALVHAAGGSLWFMR